LRIVTQTDRERVPSTKVVFSAVRSNVTWSLAPPDVGSVRVSPKNPQVTSWKGVGEGEYGTSGSGMDGWVVGPVDAGDEGTGDAVSDGQAVSSAAETTRRAWRRLGMERSAVYRPRAMLSAWMSSDS
jgi:hypothetical protein